MNALPLIGREATTWAERSALIDEFSDEVWAALFLGPDRMTPELEAELNHLMRYDIAAARDLLQGEALRVRTPEGSES